jgi:hypothetical protein
MEAIFSSETSVDFQRTTRRYIPEDVTLHNHRCENRKSYKTQDLATEMVLHKHCFVRHMYWSSAALAGQATKTLVISNVQPEG